MPPSPSTSSTPGPEPGVPPLDDDDDADAADDAGADGAGERDGADGDGDDGDGDDGAEDGYGFADACDESGRVASRPGFPLQSPLRSDFRCNPSRLRSLRSLRAPLARQLAALAAACQPAAVAAAFGASVRVTAVSSSRRCCAPRSSRYSPRSPFAGCAGCGLRLRSALAALRASTVRASPRTGLGTASRSAARTRAGTIASASGSVLRTAACGSGRTAARSRAAAAPTSRARRRPFPLRSCRAMAVPDRPGAASVLTPDASLMRGTPWLSVPAIPCAAP